jgi:hypothetical protein
MSPEFQRAYLELLGKRDLDPTPRRIVDGSVAALSRDYCSSDEFLRRSSATTAACSIFSLRLIIIQQSGCTGGTFAS